MTCLLNPLLPVSTYGGFGFGRAGAMPGPGYIQVGSHLSDTQLMEPAVHLYFVPQGLSQGLLSDVYTYKSTFLMSYVVSQLAHQLNPVH